MGKDRGFLWRFARRITLRQWMRRPGAYSLIIMRKPCVLFHSDRCFVGIGTRRNGAE